MIVNPQTSLSHSNDIMDHSCENFFVKRKLTYDDPIRNMDTFIQAKRRLIQKEFSHSNEAFQESVTADIPTANSLDMNFNLSATGFINDLFNYDANVVPVQTNFTNEFDGHWSNTDLLELDHRYNSGLSLITEDSHQAHIQQDMSNNNSELSQVDITQGQQQDFSVQNQDIETPEHTHQSTSGPFNSDAESDFEDKNLSWLFNFKLDELPHLSPEVNQNHTTAGSKVGQGNTARYQSRSQSKAGKKFEELVMEVTSDLDTREVIVGENITVDSSPRMPKKPPFTYTELIEYALEDKGELTVSGIYQWISDRFPFYKSNDDRWKNSVRHNLSINPHFRKGVKAPQGAGHLWTISSGDSEENILAWEHKKQRLDLFFKMESMHRDKSTSPQINRDKTQQSYDEAAMAAATISNEMNSSFGSDQSSDSNSQLSCDNITAITSNTSTETSSAIKVTPNHDLPFTDLLSDDDLRRTAGQILSGVHREVEVQAVNSIINTYQDSLLDAEDYLSPIQKDVSVHDCDLRNDFYVTEIDPIELGIHMSQVEEEVLFNDEFNLNYFGYNGNNDIVA